MEKNTDQNSSTILEIILTKIDPYFPFIKRKKNLHSKAHILQKHSVIVWPVEIYHIFSAEKMSLR